jgi:hypothetical protein
VCWLLAWFTGISYEKVTVFTAYGDAITHHSVGVRFGGTELSRLFAAAAAILLAFVVRQISEGQRGRVGG